VAVLGSVALLSAVHKQWKPTENQPTIRSLESVPKPKSGIWRDLQPGFRLDNIEASDLHEQADDPKL